MNVVSFGGGTNSTAMIIGMYLHKIPIACMDAETAIPVGGFMGNGKIIGEFMCKGFIPFSNGRPCFVAGTPEEIERMACLTRKEIWEYADPPYMLHTRKGKQYIVEMAEEAQHIELLDALKEHPGPVILSGYDNDLYNEHLQGWKKLHRRAQAEGGAARTETVWLNYEPETGGKVYETV